MGVVDLVGATASVVSFVMLWPQALRIWSARRDPVILAGASAGTQMLVLVNATLWGVYAVLTGAFWVGAPGLVNAPVALACLVLMHRARRLAPLVDRPGCGCPTPTDVPHEVFVTAPPGWGSVMACTPASRAAGVVVTDPDDVARLREQARPVPAQ